MKTSLEATTYHGFLKEIEEAGESKLKEVIDGYVKDYMGSIIGVYDGDEPYDEESSERETSVLGCKSPVERIMYTAMLANLKDDFLVGDNTFVLTQREINVRGNKYYVDFEVCYLDSTGESIEIFVEVDGHKYHNDSKEKVTKDRQRERAIRSKNKNLLVFTGSEVFNNYNECAMEVVDTLKNLVKNKRV